MRVAVCAARRPFSEKELVLAFELGRELALNGFDVVTGATIGVSLEAARGARLAGGRVFGVSPAKNAQEHAGVLGYPLKEFDQIDFTGQGFLRRNIVLVEGSDAVVFVGGRVGTLNEFSAALHLKKPAGVLQGVLGVSGSASKILEILGYRADEFGKIFFESDPKILVGLLAEFLKKNP